MGHYWGEVLNHKDPKTTAGYAYYQTRQHEQALTAHGKKILQLAIPFDNRKEDRPAPAHEILTTLAEVPAPSFPAIRSAHYIDREELYKLVWSAPVSEVAAHFGISDVGLAKVCHRTRIPVPARGYWARIESGRLLKPEPLPPAPPELLGKIRIKGRQPRVVIPALAA